MQTGRRAVGVALFLCAIMLIPLVSFPQTAELDILEGATKQATPFDQIQKITIGSENGGTDDSITLSVEDGKSITGLDLDITQSALPRVRGESFDDAGSFDHSTTTYDSMNVNSSVLSVLPQGWGWDFETANTTWALYSGTWFHGFDTTLGQTGGVNSGTKALYSHVGSYPNGMSATHWAESPVMDCSGCSGSWDLKYFRKLQIESSYYDHAYVQVTNSQGSWQNIWSNSGTMVESSFSQQTHSIGTYISGNPAFQIRFGIGTTDGSVQYTGWNIDDILIEPSGGLAGSGEGNWTSPIFGSGGLSETLRPHGHLNFNGLIPSEANFEWSLIDARTNSVIPGFDSLTVQHIDLGAIDYERYPSLRIKIHMLADSSGTPMLDSIDLENNWNDSFMSDPTERGWLLNGMTWGQNGLSGNGEALTDTRVFRSGFSAIRNSCNLPTGATLYAILSDGEYEIPSTGLLMLDKPYHEAQFKIVSNSNAVISKFSVELVQSSAPKAMGIDVGSDGAVEWGFAQQGMGRFGFQDTLSDGSIWAESYLSQSSTASFETLLPVSGVSSFGYSINAPAEELQGTTVTISVGGTSIALMNLGTLSGISNEYLSAQDVSSLNSAIASTSDTISNNGIIMAKVKIDVDSSSDGIILFGGIASGYDYEPSLRLTALNPIVLALNQELGKVTSQGGFKTVSLPIKMDSDGSVGVELLELRTNPSIAAVSIDIEGAYDTLTPSDEWIEVNATFDGSPLGLTNIESDAIGGNWDVQILIQGQNLNSVTTCPIRSLSIEGDVSAYCSQTGKQLIWEYQNEFGSINHIGNGRFISIVSKFKLPSDWDDEESASISINFITSVGPMLPATTVFGLGSALGIENDVSLKSWGIRTSNGVLVDPSDGQILPGDDVKIEINLGFEGVDHRAKPRAGQVQLNFYSEDMLVNSSSIVFEGFQIFDFSIPNIGSNLNLKVELIPLENVGIHYEVSRFGLLNYDPISPTLMEQSVEKFDHKPSSRKSTFTFSIADRPSLPTNAQAHYWRSWIDDFNFDGIMQMNEVNSIDMEVPANTSYLIGDYHFTIDTARAQQGEYLSAWLEVSDDAGNLMDGGNFDEPLFNVMISDDGSPRIPVDEISWNRPSPVWIHPAEVANLSIPVYDINGYADIEMIELDLSSNQPGQDVITFDQTSGTCSSSSYFIQIESCTLEGTNTSVFSASGVFEISLSYDWAYNPDSSVIHKPRIKLQDRQGQSSVTILEELDWKFSPEIQIVSNSLSFSVNGESKPQNDIFVKPDDLINLEGDVTWFRTGGVVNESFEFDMALGPQSQIFTATETFNTTISAPLSEGKFPLFIDMVDSPNGAIDRTTESGVIWFIVDGAEPTITEILKPSQGLVIPESSFSNVEFEFRIKETNAIDENSLNLNWAIYPKGSGFGAQSLIQGQESVSILGARNYGESIPCVSSIDIDSVLDTNQRTRELDLRVWISGLDESGREINKTFNDLDTPRGIWALEQRVADFELRETEDLPNRLKVGDVVDLGLEIRNIGQADGSAALIIELVESDGAKTRIHAQNIQVESNSTFVWEGTWTTNREGTMWIEYQIVEQQMIQSDTVRVDSNGNGLLGGGSGFSPVIFVIMMGIVLGLTGVLIYQIRDN